MSRLITVIYDGDRPIDANELMKVVLRRCGMTYEEEIRHLNSYDIEDTTEEDLIRYRHYMDKRFPDRSSFEKA